MSISFQAMHSLFQYIQTAEECLGYAKPFEEVSYTYEGMCSPPTVISKVKKRGTEARWFAKHPCLDFTNPINQYLVKDHHFCSVFPYDQNLHVMMCQ